MLTTGRSLSALISSGILALCLATGCARSPAGSEVLAASDQVFNLDAITSALAAATSMQGYQSKVQLKLQESPAGYFAAQLAKINNNTYAIGDVKVSHLQDALQAQNAALSRIGQSNSSLAQMWGITSASQLQIPTAADIHAALATAVASLDLATSTSSDEVELALAGASASSSAAGCETVSKTYSRTSTTLQVVGFVLSFTPLNEVGDVMDAAGSVAQAAGGPPCNSKPEPASVEKLKAQIPKRVGV